MTRVAPNDQVIDAATVRTGPPRDRNDLVAAMGTHPARPSAVDVAPKERL